jgi:SAM-dependent methyltransferase
MSRAGASVEAVDFSYADVLLTRRTCGEVRVVTADVCRLPFADDSFDVVVSCHVLEHLADPRRYLREMKRVLDPRGRLWLITPNRLFSSPDGPPKNPFHIKEYWFEELVELVSDVFPAAEYLGVTHQATGGVIQAEEARNRWHSLDRFRIRRFAPSAVKRIFRRLTGAVYPAELSRVDASEFRIQAMDPRSALDFVAIVLPEG